MPDQPAPPVPGLLGGRVLLRAPRAEDADALYEITRDASTMMMLMSSRAWIPDSPDGFLARHIARLREPADAADAWFVVADRDDTVVYGQADLWGIDSHNRYGNIGLSLTPRWRGRGLGRDIVEVLCRYAFTIRGLHRLQYEASTPNTASVRTAERIGLRREALLRSYEWTYGKLSDSVVFGRLAHEWHDPGPGGPGEPTALGAAEGVAPTPTTAPPVAPTPAPVDPAPVDPAPVAADDRAADDPDPLVGRSVRLRAVRPEDARAIWMGAHDLTTWQLVQETPWLPVPYSRAERQAVEALDDLPPAREVSFAVEEIATGELVGTAYVNIFRAPHRTASIGVTLWPVARGRGLGTDVLRVVCRYLFEVRAMFRADIETLATNTALRGAARRAGFVEEGVRREHAWVDGAFADIVVAGLLLPDWTAARASGRPGA